MHFVKSVGGNIIIRGLRAASDFEYEFQMAGMNTRLDDSVETIFLPASEHNHFIASRLVKEIGSLDGDISSFVSARVADHLAKKYAEKRAQNRPVQRVFQGFSAQENFYSFSAK